MNKKAVVVLSGGLDSSTLAHHMKADGFDVYGISFNYGQRHKKELEFARRLMEEIGEDHHIIDLHAAGVTELMKESGSSLVTETDVPEGHYAADNMKATIVPNRNMMMLAIATSYAVSIGAEKVATGVHAGDHAVYPDCRPDFIYSMQASIVLGNEGFLAGTEYPHQFLTAPFLYWSKNDIAAEAFELGVDIAMTWSCYKGGDLHCGRCGTCVERLEAIHSTGNADPTSYANDTFWLEALASTSPTTDN